MSIEPCLIAGIEAALERNGIGPPKFDDHP